MGAAPGAFARADASRTLPVAPAGGNMTWSPPLKRRRHFFATYGGERDKQAEGSPALGKFLPHTAVNLTRVPERYPPWRISATRRARPALKRPTVTPPI